jgi:hypothetical protein
MFEDHHALLSCGLSIERRQGCLLNFGAIRCCIRSQSREAEFLLFVFVARVRKRGTSTIARETIGSLLAMTIIDRSC